MEGKRVLGDYALMRGFGATVVPLRSRAKPS